MPVIIKIELWLIQHPSWWSGSEWSSQTLQIGAGRLKDIVGEHSALFFFFKIFFVKTMDRHSFGLFDHYHSAQLKTLTSPPCNFSIIFSPWVCVAFGDRQPFCFDLLILTSQLIMQKWPSPKMLSSKVIDFNCCALHTHTHRQRHLWVCVGESFPPVCVCCCKHFTRPVPATKIQLLMEQHEQLNPTRTIIHATQAYKWLFSKICARKTDTRVTAKWCPLVAWTSWRMTFTVVLASLFLLQADFWISMCFFFCFFFLI